MCVYVVVYASTEADYPNNAIDDVYKAHTESSPSSKPCWPNIQTYCFWGVFLLGRDSGTRKHSWLLISIMQTFGLWSSITSLPC